MGRPVRDEHPAEVLQAFEDYQKGRRAHPPPVHIPPRGIVEG